MIYDAFSINHYRNFDTNKSDSDVIEDITNYISELKSGKIFEDWYIQNISVGIFMLLPRRLKKFYVSSVLDDQLRGNMLISNLGVFEFDSYEFGGSEITDFFSFPNVGGPLRLGFFFCTFSGRLKLTLVYDTRCFELPIRQSVIEPFVSILNSIADRELESES